MAVVEHPHLDRIPTGEIETYIDALAYDKDYYRTVGPKIKALIDKASKIVVSCDGAELVYDCDFEDAKLNIGEYSTMKNTGGQFPIGEVFTEPTQFAKVNGTVKLYAYGNETSRVVVPEEPVLVVIKEGVIVDYPNAPESFTAIMDKIKEDEELWVRELGLGMNRAMTRTRILNDVGSYERMCGVHMSIGKKHTIYKKEGFPKRSSKYHVDVFVDVTTVKIDDVVVFENGGYIV
jgi:leucyl aminopeptidase (aminopeptidase T)